MAANSFSAPIQAQNSPRSRQLRNSTAARVVSEISPPMSGIVDQEQFLTSSSSTASDSLPVKEANNTASLEDAELENSDNGGAKKRAWNKPSNGATATAELGAVMGAESWPALSDSARASPKSPSTYSLKPTHGSVAQELDVVSLSPKEVSTSISSPNSNSNHVPSRQRSMKRGGGGSSSHNTPPNDSSSQAHGSVVDVVPPNQGKTGNYGGEYPRDNPNKDLPHRGRAAHGGGNESQPQRNSFRRSNSGPLVRGDGSYHHGRRDHERGKDYGNRSFGSREQRVGSRPFFRGPSPNAPFIPPPPSVAVRPFVPPVVYNEMPPVFYVPGPHPDSLRQMPMVPMFIPMHDPHLPSKIVNQIEYYFSNENLVKDTFLRQNMDAEGWVSIKLIAGFKKVMQLTDNIQLILDVIQASNVVEVQGDKVRRRSDWIRWIMPAVQSTNMLAAHLNNVALEENAAT